MFKTSVNALCLGANIMQTVLSQLQDQYRLTKDLNYIYRFITIERIFEQSWAHIRTW